MSEGPNRRDRRYPSWLRAAMAAMAGAFVPDAGTSRPSVPLLHRVAPLLRKTKHQRHQGKRECERRRRRTGVGAGAR